MAKPYSIDLRERVIIKFLEGKSVKEIVKELNVKKSFVYAMLKLYKETGSVEPKRGNRGRKPSLNEEKLILIEAEIRKNPDITLQELKERLNLNVALSTLCDAINNKLKLKYKKKLYTQLDKIEKML